MAQGKAFTEKQKDKIIKSLEEYLKLGYSRNKACDLIGLTPQTLSVWVKDDSALLMKIQGWENFVNVKARANIVNKIVKNKDVEQSKWWAERKMKDEFSTRVENTGADGKDLIPNEEHKKKSDEAISEFLNEQNPTNIK